MRNLYVPLERDELDHLVELARNERRRPQDQAALLLVEAIKARTSESSRTTESTPPLVAA